jgi:hypothetical protein
VHHEEGRLDLEDVDCVLAIPANKPEGKDDGTVLRTSGRILNPADSYYSVLSAKGNPERGIIQIK